MNKSGLIKLIWIPSTFFIVLIGLFFLRMYDFKKLDSSIASEMRDLTEMRNMTISINELRSQLKACDKDLKSHQREFYGFDDAVSLVKTINETANVYNVELVDFEYDIGQFVSQSKNHDQAGPFTVPFGSKFRGDFLALGKFIQDLENKAYIESISTIKLSNTGKEFSGVIGDIGGIIRFINHAELN
ncbi:MAG: hypothetical protein GY855_13465 [candidate division Zixibacteria bacterium]|nr:hypothetical protein [candidate division Zixibacteria bacterium]